MAMTDEQFIRSATRWTFEDAEQSLHMGIISPEQFEGYAHAWQTSCHRYSTFAECYAQSTDPAVLTLSALICSAVAR